ncbi:hypothetical protein OPW33_22925 [Vibrio europaeus]|uniref:hypothetical protein n=1 Tax=Vibrio europaeus TaxID=300876 RepID=UPI00233FE825|nr:hypothetical protein [Vibrio europaeus]MDC5842185.1 hypothetical protein [Vibrio europaeus]
MKCNVKAILLPALLMTLSQVVFANSYEEYKVKVKECIAVEEQKAPLTVSDISDLSVDDVEKYILFLKDIRIQRCSANEELAALADEINSKESVDSKLMEQRYLSVYLKAQMHDLSSEEKLMLTQLDNRLQQKGLEVNMLEIVDELKNQ